MISKSATRLGLTVIALALVLVPTMARARQRVEHREATRLSIKHSWLGVAPSSKATGPAQPIVDAPASASVPEPPRIARAFHPTLVANLGSVLLQSSDPLRGPPALRLS